MARKGRPPKPDKLKKLEGTYRPDRDRSEDIAKFPMIIDPGEPPEWFNELQRREYEFLTGELIRLNLLESVDMNLVVAYCVAASQYFYATQKLQENYTMFNKGKLTLSPYFKMQKDNLNDMMRIGSLFGFSPVDRQRLKSAKKNIPETDPLTGEI